jgi:hypothetical protein
MADITDRKDEDENIFNMGLDNQQHIQTLLKRASDFYIAGEVRLRAKCLIEVKMIIFSECISNDKTKFDEMVERIEPLINTFDNLCRTKCIQYDPVGCRYLILKNKESFAIFADLDKELNLFGQALREKLSPILFPKTADKRFALANR